MIIREGFSQIFIPDETLSSGPGTKRVGFYNPEQVLNRDITVAVVNAIKPRNYLDGFGGTGIRGIRVTKETGVHSVIAEINRKSVEVIERNGKENEVELEIRNEPFESVVSRSLFDFIHNNPIAEFHPSHYVNDPFIISQNKKMVAINSALQIDLTGQVCADSIGYKFYSGFGGQVDFIRGAARSEGGKPIMALSSTARGGSVSRIVSHLAEGAGVTTSRGDVHYVATEFGVVNLHGKSISERAKMLIGISHPKFRDELMRFAKERRWL